MSDQNQPAPERLENRPPWAANLTDREYELTTRGIFGINAAAAYLDTSPGYVRKLIAKGTIVARKVGKHVRIHKAQLDAILGIA